MDCQKKERTLVRPELIKAIALQFNMAIAFCFLDLYKIRVFEDFASIHRYYTDPQIL